MQGRHVYTDVYNHNEIIKYISLLLIFSMNLYAGTTGKIVGKVTDENGNALIGCNVIVKGTSLGAATNQNGEYFILNVPPGYYQVSASMIRSILHFSCPNHFGIKSFTHLIKTELIKSITMIILSQNSIMGLFIDQQRRMKASQW